MPEEVCQVHRACGQDWQVVEKEEDKLPICSSITAYRQFLCGERSNFALRKSRKRLVKKPNSVFLGAFRLWAQAEALLIKNKRRGAEARRNEK